MALDYILLESFEANARMGAIFIGFFLFAFMAIALVIWFAITVIVYLYRKHSKGEDISFFQSCKRNMVINVLLGISAVLFLFCLIMLIIHWE